MEVPRQSAPWYRRGMDVMDTHNLAEGQKLGTYVVLQCLGPGVNGAVYLARNPEIDAKVAVKVLPPELIGEDEQVSRFIDEARAVNVINHPGVVRIMDMGTHEDVGLYLVMEFISGRSLQQMIDGQEFPSLEEAVHIIRSIASVMAKVHETGIAHRGLRPASVFLVQDPEYPGGRRARITDFGMAKFLQDGENAGLTRTGTQLGVPAYMSPEQCLDAKSVDHRTDIFALGVIAYQLMARQLPFVGNSIGEIVLRHAKGKPETLLARYKNLPLAVDRTIQKALEIDADRRWPSMAALSDALSFLPQGWANLVAPREEEPPKPARGGFWQGASAKGMSSRVFIDGDEGDGGGDKER